MSRVMGQEEFLDALAEHQRWMTSSGFDEGKKLTLENVEIHGANDLCGLRLNGVTFRGVRFENCSLKGSVFIFSNLVNCNFVNCNFYGAEFCNTTIIHSTFHYGDFVDIIWNGSTHIGNTFFHNCMTSGVDYTLPRSHNINVASYAIDAPVSTFSYSRHFGIAQGDYIRIGCERHSVDKWMCEYKKLGKTNMYGLDEINMYGGWIKMIKKERDRVKKNNLKSA